MFIDLLGTLGIAPKNLESNNPQTIDAQIDNSLTPDSEFDQVLDNLRVKNPTRKEIPENVQLEALSLPSDRGKISSAFDAEQGGNDSPYIGYGLPLFEDIGVMPTHQPQTQTQTQPQVQVQVQNADVMLNTGLTLQGPPIMAGVVANAMETQPQVTLNQASRIPQVADHLNANMTTIKVLPGKHHLNAQANHANMGQLLSVAPQAVIEITSPGQIQAQASTKAMAPQYDAFTQSPNTTERIVATPLSANQAMPNLANNSEAGWAQTVPKLSKPNDSTHAAANVELPPFQQTKPDPNRQEPRHMTAQNALQSQAMLDKSQALATQGQNSELTAKQTKGTPNTEAQLIESNKQIDKSMQSVVQAQQTEKPIPKATSETVAGQHLAQPLNQDGMSKTKSAYQGNSGRMENSHYIPESNQASVSNRQASTNSENQPGRALADLELNTPMPSSTRTTGVDATSTTPQVRVDGSQGLNIQSQETLVTSSGKATSANGANATQTSTDEVSAGINQQIMRAINRQALAQGRITLQLTPHELGSLEIELRHEKGEFQVAIVAREQATKELIDSSLIRLRQSLADAGVPLTNLEVRSEMQQQDPNARHRQTRFADHSPTESNAESTQSEQSLEIAHEGSVHIYV